MNTDETDVDTRDLGLPPDRWEMLVRAIVDDGTQELAQRRAEQRVLATLDTWSRKSFYAPVAMAAAAAALLLWAGPVSRDQVPAPTLTEAVAPITVAAWLSTEFEVDPLMLALALTQEDR
jgi:hypothetical protein